MRPPSSASEEGMEEEEEEEEGVVEEEEGEERRVCCRATSFSSWARRTWSSGWVGGWDGGRGKGRGARNERVGGEEEGRGTYLVGGLEVAVGWEGGKGGLDVLLEGKELGDVVGADAVWGGRGGWVGGGVEWG